MISCLLWPVLPIFRLQACQLFYGLPGGERLCASWLLTFPNHFQILEDFQRDTQNEFERVKIFVLLWCRAYENWYVSHASINASRLVGVYQYNKRFLLVMIFTSTSAMDSHLENGPIDYWPCNEHRCLMRRKMFLPSLVSTMIKHVSNNFVVTW